ncbi:SIR2 family protein [Nesterenkonia aurantiaca]|uniref:SIR2 family protein n=1 Tax=Nesterenkonia aurantiaca TaxID=1436010 RepID=UPI003EE7E2E7
MTTRTAVLLGAGASKESGLLLASELSAHLVHKLNEDAMERGEGSVPWLRALNFTYGAMLSHSSGEGSSPLYGVNIERLVSALRLLQERNNHEAAPFVSLWKEGVRGFQTSKLPDGHHEELLESLRDALELPAKNRHKRSSRQPQKWALAKPLEQQIGRIARKATALPSANVFKEAESQLLIALSQHLESFKGTDHLDPIGVMARDTSGGLDVLTLNYDTTVEAMAKACDVSVETGLLYWRPGHELDFHSRGAKLRLYKLHGSVDWEYLPGENAAVPPVIVERDVDADTEYAEEEWDENEPPMPWVVVGDREKLSTDGPTLPLLRAAEQALSRSGCLVVVGYSFADDHINYMIRNWMAGGLSRKLRIVDPHWTSRSNVNSFKRDLLAHYVGEPDPGLGSRVQVFKGDTKTMLAPALTVTSQAPGAVPFEVSVLDTTHGVVKAHLKYFGPGLRSLRLEGKQQLVEEPTGYAQRAVSYAEKEAGGRHTSLRLPGHIDVDDVPVHLEIDLEMEYEGSEPLFLELTAFPYSMVGRKGWQRKIELVIPPE